MHETAAHLGSEAPPRLPLFRARSLSTQHSRSLLTPPLFPGVQIDEHLTAELSLCSSYARSAPAAFGHCRAKVAHTKQSRPDSGLGFQVEILKTLGSVPSWLGRSFISSPLWTP